MSSFSMKQRTTSEGQGEMTKYPIKRLEISIKNFIKVLSIALERLHKHSNNIKRLTAMEDWPELHKEQVNATRTVQQITANIKEIEKVRCQVNDEDLPQFDNRVSDVKTEAVTALDDFLVLLGGEAAEDLGVSQTGSYGKGDLPPMKEESQRPPQSPLTKSAAAKTSSSSSSSLPGTTKPPMAANESSPSAMTPASTNHHSQSTDSVRTNTADDADFVDNAFPEADSVHTPLLVTSNLHVIPQHSEASASWEQLKENIEDLNELVHVFAERVEEQGEPINCIEDNIDSAHANVTEGTSHLGMASKYKAAMFPAVGAVLGGVLGGPIGFVAGLKIGGLAAVTGGAVGYAGGRYVKKRQDKIVEMEMTKMSNNTPLPEVKDEKADHTSGSKNSAQSGEEEEGEMSVQNLMNSFKGWFDGGKEKK